MKTAERLEARKLRTEGWSIGEIEQHLDVARSSVSRWVRDVEVCGAARERLIARARLGPIIAAERTAARARAVRVLHQERGRRLIHERDSSYAVGCTLLLPYGTGDLVVNSTEIVQTIYGSIQELGGFDRPEWLD